MTGYLRFNTTTAAFEGYNGSSWTSVGGANVSNDTSTATALYPLFANVTSGAATSVFTSNAKTEITRTKNICNLISLQDEESLYAGICSR